MTHDRFKDLQLGIAVDGIDEEPSKTPQKKKNRMHGLFVWKNLSLILVNPAYSLIRTCRFCICAKQWSFHWHAKCHAISVMSGTRKQYSFNRILLHISHLLKMRKRMLMNIVLILTSSKLDATFP